MPTKRDERLSREAKFGAAAWAAAKVATKSSQALFSRAHFWIGLLSGIDSKEYANYWANGTVPTLKGRLPRLSRTFCPNARMKNTNAFESNTYCEAHLPSLPDNESCAVFAIGIGNGWSYARYAAAKGCQVHAFDPTLELRGDHHRVAKTIHDVRFHFAGLRGTQQPPKGEGWATSKRSYNSCGAIDDAQLMTLDAMKAATLSAGTKLSVLAMDCEGCEWAAFEEITNTSAKALEHVQLVTMEAHVTPTMIPPSLQQFVGLFDLMLNKLGFKLWWQRTNDGYPFDQQVVEFLGVGGLKAGICCYELAFVRSHEVMLHIGRTAARHHRMRARRSVGSQGSNSLPLK
jgi:hypothetical protein